MVVIIASAVLILGIAAFQVVQGLFSALVMAVLTVLCAALSFAVYEPLAALLYSVQPAHADAGALIATFLIPLIVLRTLADRFIPGNVVLGVWADRIFGGMCGIVTGMILTGMLMIAVQMLPVGAEIWGYKPFDEAGRRSSALMPFYCDEFVVGLMGTLSAGSLSSKERLDDIHEDLLLESFCTRNTAGMFGRVDALPDALLSVMAFRAPERRMVTWRKDIPANPLLDEDEVTKLLVVRCEIDVSARDEADQKDPAQRWRLPATQFRLVTKSGHSYYPIAYLTYGRGWEAHPALSVHTPAAITKLAVVRPAAKGAKSLFVDWVYRVRDADHVRYLAFRRTSKQAFTDENDFTEKGGKMPRGVDALDREGRYDVIPPQPGKRKKR